MYDEAGYTSFSYLIDTVLHKHRVISRARRQTECLSCMDPTLGTRLDRIFLAIYSALEKSQTAESDQLDQGGCRQTLVRLTWSRP